MSAEGPVLFSNATRVTDQALRQGRDGSAAAVRRVRADLVAKVAEHIEYLPVIATSYDDARAEHTFEARVIVATVEQYNAALKDAADKAYDTAHDKAKDAIAATEALLAEYDAGELIEGQERAEYLAEQLRELLAVAKRTRAVRA